MTIADVAVFHSVSQHRQAVEGRLNLKRWFKLIQSRVSFENPIVEDEAPFIFYLPVKETNGASKASDKLVKVKPAGDAPKQPAEVSDKSAPKSKEEAKPADAPKKDKAVSSSEAKAAPSVVDLNPMKLDLRVGVILRCWDHPEAEKLLCEEIDVGEDKPRQIASGLRAHYSAASMEGQRVVVLANLKERAMVGFKSQGMVLCSCNEDHSVIKLVNPPPEARPGDRITFDGFEGEPATPNEMVKKKILENLAPYFKTDDLGVANWNGVPFKVAAGVCTSENKNGTVS